MFVVKRSHHNPILVPDKDHYWEAFATFNMSVIKKGRILYGVNACRLLRPSLIGKNMAVKILGLLISKEIIIYFILRSPNILLKQAGSKSQSRFPKI
ncbi:MAG: hypothetical protein US12_C0040G0006 [Parcubacteria group bacterium GW2011_GWA2_36_24]|nr:MAG: hypothetical protein US12_C0040G0006 [Parcubacteria group bacterium GW2011_GWA2_36_24]